MKAKIIATIGPASESKETIAQMITAGVSIFRYNFSHATYPEYERYYKLIHQIAVGLHKEVAVLQDLQGPRIRIGNLSHHRVLKKGQIVRFANQAQKETDIPITDDELIADLKVGDPILIDNGLIELEVSEVTDHQVYARVIRGGTIRTHKGINVPRTPLSIRALTDKDREDVAFALSVGVEYIALSFVQDKTDIEDLRTLIGNNPVKIVPKIERSQAVKNFDEIARVSDLIMIARGDLGIEIPPEEVPIVQKELIGKAHQHHKPVIVATQLLTSMIEQPQPTRAEMSDIVTAAEQGADYLMVSDETAIGKYPVEVVNFLARGIGAVEHEKHKQKPSSRLKRFISRKG